MALDAPNGASLVEELGAPTGASRVEEMGAPVGAPPVAELGAPVGAPRVEELGAPRGAPSADETGAPLRLRPLVIGPTDGDGITPSGRAAEAAGADDESRCELEGTLLSGRALEGAPPLSDPTNSNNFS